MSGNSMSLGMFIGGGYYGGYVSEKGSVSPPQVETSTDINNRNTPGPGSAHTTVSSHQTPYAKDPVEMAGGAFFHDRTDLALGGRAPLGLSFTRSYNSGRHPDDREMGKGWTHNCDIALSRLSHGGPGLGNATEFTYNGQHQVTSSSSSPEAGVTLTETVSYLANGLVSTTTDPNQVTTTTTYDAFGFTTAFTR